MRKLLFITALAFIGGIAFGQNLQQGTVLSLRLDIRILKPGVTMDQNVDFLIDRFSPEFEKAFPGTRVFILMGNSGEKKDWFGSLIYMESIEVRDKLFRSPGTSEHRAKLNPVLEEMKKYKDSSYNVTDWVIQ